MKKTTPGNGSAGKPLQARTPSSQGVKDMDIAALMAKVAVQEGLSNNLYQHYVELTLLSRD